MDFKFRKKVKEMLVATIYLQAKIHTLNYFYIDLGTLTDTVRYDK